VQLLNEQAQLFMAAAACLLVGLVLLTLAYCFYEWLLDKFLHMIALHGILCDFIRAKENRRKWWLNFHNILRRRD
jgi:hypothetical protein